jgi:hypothetical protein
MALVKLKPQNELGDIMSKPCAANQIGFFIFVQRVV